MADAFAHGERVLAGTESCTRSDFKRCGCVPQLRGWRSRSQAEVSPGWRREQRLRIQAPIRWKRKRRKRKRRKWKTPKASEIDTCAFRRRLRLATASSKARGARARNDIPSEK